MSLIARLDRGDFTVPGSVIPARIRRAMLARAEEGGNVGAWVRRALTNTLPVMAPAGYRR